MRDGLELRARLAAALELVNLARARRALRTTETAAARSVEKVFRLLGAASDATKVIARNVRRSLEALDTIPQGDRWALGRELEALRREGVEEHEAEKPESDEDDDDADDEDEDQDEDEEEPTPVRRRRRS